MEEFISKNKRFKLEIIQDENPESPRNWDNLGKIVAFHGRYDLGDKTTLKSSDFNGWDGLRDHLVKEEKAVIIFPLFLYDHSGLRLKIGSFQGLLPGGHAEFDSGCIGFIYATKEKIQKEFGVKKISKAVLVHAEKILRGEVETYDDYLSGSVYGFKLLKVKDEIFFQKKFSFAPKEEIPYEEEVDSCWGFFGCDPKTNGIKDSLPKEAQFSF